MGKVILKEDAFVRLPETETVDELLFEAGEENVDKIHLILPKNFYVDEECAFSTYKADYFNYVYNNELEHMFTDTKTDSVKVANDVKKTVNYMVYSID